MPNSGISLPEKDTERMLDSGCPEPHEKKKKEGEEEEEEEEKDVRKRESSFDIQVKMDEVRRREKINVREAKANNRITKCCPPAPRKPKSRKRNERCWFRRSVLLDVSTEVESMFPPHILQDFGKKIKKARS